jgi:hypothetical protein
MCCCGIGGPCKEKKLLMQSPNWRQCYNLLMWEIKITKIKTVDNRKKLQRIG